MPLKWIYILKLQLTTMVLFSYRANETILKANSFKPRGFLFEMVEFNQIQDNWEWCEVQFDPGVFWGMHSNCIR